MLEITCESPYSSDRTLYNANYALISANFTFCTENITSKTKWKVNVEMSPPLELSELHVLKVLVTVLWPIIKVLSNFRKHENNSVIR